MSKERAAIGANGLPLPILPPERDVRVWAKLTRVVVYTPGFLALLLLKVGEPTGFGITVELLMLGSTAANRMGAFAVEKALVATLVISMALVVFYGVMKLRQMQAEYDDNLPLKPHKDDK